MQLSSVFILIMFILNCATVSSVRNAPLHAGKKQVFHADFEKTIEAATAAMMEAGLEIESRDEVDDNTYMLVSKKSSTAVSWGELVRVVVVKKDSKETEVRVHTKRRVAMNVIAKGDYSEKIFGSIEYFLKKNTP